MRIGFIPAASVQQAQSRATSTSSPMTPNFSGGVNPAPALFAGARQISAVANSLYDEDVKKRDFEAQKEYYRVTGELLRKQDEFMQQAPSNGDGIRRFAAESWETEYTGFLGSLSPDLQDRYASLGEAFKQTYLRRAEEQERGALRGDSMRTLDEFLTGANSALIADPSARDALEAQYASLLQSAPGLTEAERKEFARKGLEASATAWAQGSLFQNNQRRFVDPSNPFMFSALADAVEFAESGGNPDAVSPTGVVGLMQVTVGTAREIARALEDPSFPHGGSVAEVQAYIRRPEVSRQYGEKYLRDRLVEFGGDVEAALVAYNAGPGRARQWLAAGRDYNVIGQVDGEAKQREVMGYTQRVMRRMGITAEEEILADPDLTADARLTAANAARQQAFETQRTAGNAIASIRETRVNAATAAIAGGAGLEQVAALVRDSVIQEGDSDWVRLTGQIETQQRRLLAATEAVRLFAGGATAMKAEHIEELTAPLTRAVVEGDAEATQMFMQVWRQLGDASASMQGALREMLSSPRQADVLRGMQMLTQMSLTHTAGWNNKLDGEFGAAVAVYRAGQEQGLSPDKILEMYRPFSVPGAQNEFSRRKETARRAVESAGLSFFKQGGWISSGAVPIDIDPADPRMQTMVERAREAYMRIVPLYGDEESVQAQKHVKDILATQFGEYNGHWDYMPPNLAYPPDVEGGHEWITQQFIRDSGRLNIQTRTPIRFKTSSWNRREFEATGRRTYTVEYTQDNTFEIQNLEAKPSLTAQETLQLETLREQNGLVGTLFHWQPSPEDNATYRQARREALGATAIENDAAVNELETIDRMLANPDLDPVRRQAFEDARNVILRRQ